MQLGQLYKETVQQFITAGIEQAQSEADQLLGYCLGMTRSQLFLNRQEEISTSQVVHCRTLIDRRLSREPLHYILGTREFWSLDFYVTADVLIPRPETEFLIEQVLETIKTTGYQGGKIVDMCTGSGIIAVVLSLELNTKKVIAVDASPDALLVAAENISRHGKTNDISLVCADLFTSFQSGAEFELVVANPPYVADSALADLQPEVRDWEPERALAGGVRGLDLIEKIADQVHKHLLPGGWLLLEIGADQEAAVRRIFTDSPGGVYDRIDIIEDWAKRPRVLKARKRIMVDG